MRRSYWRTVSLVTVWQIAASICYYTVFAATPFFRDAFGLDGFTVGIIITVLTLGYAVFLLPIGMLTDRVGERRTLAVGLAGLSASILLVAGAPNYAVLLVSVFCLGAMYGTAIPGTNKAVFDNIEPGRQNLAMGIKQVGVTGGSGISALAVTGLAGILFWQAGFLLASAFGVAVTVAFFVLYRGDSSGGVARYPDPRDLTSNYPYLMLVAAGFFLGAALFTTTAYTVLYVEESIQASVFVGGVVLALVQLFGSVGRVLSGWLSDWLPGKPQTRIGLILLVQTLGSGVMFAVVAATDTALGAAVAFSVLGFFVLGYTGVYYSCMATLVTANEIGGATAGGQLALTTGSLFAPPAFGWLADTVGYTAGWYLLGGCVAVAAVLVAVVIRMPATVATPAAADDPNE